MRCGKILIITFLGLSIALNGCSNLSTRQNNAAAGAAVGGVAGASPYWGQCIRYGW